MVEEIIPFEILETPKAIRETVLKTRPAAQAAAEAINKRQPRRIFITGNGTSYYSSVAASYTGRMLSGPDDAMVIAVPSGDFRYFTPFLDKNDVIIAISASGEFRDVLAIIERVRSKILCIGITQIPGSNLEKLADITLVAGGGLSHSPVMTMTYASTLTAAHLLLLEYLKISSFHQNAANRGSRQPKT
jgi:fructoselysine-6-P-deglycase FrlB-like protein